MKSTPRRRRQQARQPEQQQAAASLGGQVAVAEDGTTIDTTAGRLSVGATVISASKTRYGVRAFTKLWYAQAAIDALYPGAPPKHVTYLKLARDVNEQLKKDPEYHLGELGPMTVRRALKALRAANSDPRVI